MGNFSRDPADTLNRAEAEHYVGLHVEQGVPLLDRDLNLMHDLIASAVRTALRDYIGDGIAGTDDAFKIAPGGPGEVLRILAGGRHFLAGGLRLTIDTDTSLVQQPHAWKLAADEKQLAVGDNTVYLDAWTEEIDETGNAELLNPDDVGMRTSVRVRNCWIVRITTEAEPPGAVDGHVHVPLARVTLREEGQPVEAIEDLRRTRVNVADLLRRSERALAPAFAAERNQVRPTVAVETSKLTLFGRNLETATSVIFQPERDDPGHPPADRRAPVEMALEPGRSPVEPGDRPGEVMITTPPEVRGECTVVVSNEFAKAATSDLVTVLGRDELRPADDGWSSYARAINHAGVVVGRSDGKPARWHRAGGTWKSVLLKPLSQDVTSGEAVDLSDGGIVVGHSGDLPAVWLHGDDAPPTLLKVGDSVRPQRVEAISRDARWIVGGLTDEHLQQAVVWCREGDQFITCTLNTDGAYRLRDVNEAGTIVGSAYDPAWPWPSTRPFYWILSEGYCWTAREIALPDSAIGGEACAINEAGIITGSYQQSARGGETLVFVWDSGTGAFLATGLQLQNPCGVTARNQVLASLPLEGLWEDLPPHGPAFWDPRDGVIPLRVADTDILASGCNEYGEFVANQTPDFTDGKASAFVRW